MMVLVEQGPGTRAQCLYFRLGIDTTDGRECPGTGVLPIISYLLASFLLRTHTDNGEGLDSWSLFRALPYNSTPRGEVGFVPKKNAQVGAMDQTEQTTPALNHAGHTASSWSHASVRGRVGHRGGCQHPAGPTPSWVHSESEGWG